MHERGPAQVRFSLIGLVLATFAVGLAPTSLAGSAAAPEVADPAGDQSLDALMGFPIGTVPVVSDAADLRAGWISENTTHLFLNIQAEGDIASVAGLATFQYVFHLNVAGTDYEATADVGFGFSMTLSGAEAGGVATEATLDGAVLNLTVPKAAVGNATKGTVVSGLFIESAGTIVTPPIGSGIDRAPNAGFGLNYTVLGGPAAVNPFDTDGDGLNDTWEVKYFGNTTAQNATGDPDADGLTNGEEQALGSDPTKADTDGDGVNDKQDPSPAGEFPDVDGDGLNDTWEIKHFGNTTAQTGTGDPDGDGCNNLCEYAKGTDPNKADTDGDGVKDSQDAFPLDPKRSTTAGSSSSSSTSRSTTSTSRSSSTNAAGSGNVDSFDEAVDRLTSDAGYLGISGAGFLAVVALAIIGLVVRWSL